MRGLSRGSPVSPGDDLFLVQILVRASSYSSEAERNLRTGFSLETTTEARFKIFNPGMGDEKARTPPASRRANSISEVNKVLLVQSR